MPDRETGGVPDLKGRGGAVLVCALWPAGFGGGSSAAGWGSSRGTRLAGATLPLEEMVTFGLVAAGSAACVLTAAAGSTFCPVREAATSAAAAGLTLGSAVASTAGLAGAVDSGAEDPASAETGFLASGSAATGFFVSGAGSAATGFFVSGSLGSGSATRTGGGGGGGFRRPSRSALRRTRSAWASTMLEECDLTPMLSAKQRSSVS